MKNGEYKSYFAIPNALAASSFAGPTNRNPAVRRARAALRLKAAYWPECFLPNATPPVIFHNFDAARCRIMAGCDVLEQYRLPVATNSEATNSLKALPIPTP